MIDKHFLSSDKDILKSIIELSRKVVLVAHVSPDGDAVGSTLALRGVLANMGKEVNVVLPDRIPKNLSFLPNSNTITLYSNNTVLCNSLLEDADLIICLDFNSSKRVGDMQESLLASKAKKVMIDHHLYPEDFCDLVISEPKVSSASLLLYKVIVALDFDKYIDKYIATSIYTGMMTDTGNFSYNSNSPEIYSVISELIKYGIDKDAIYIKACNTSTESKLRLSAYAISQKLEILKEYKTAIITLTLDELDKYNYEKGDTEGLVNQPLAIDGVAISILFREEIGMVKVSLRSQGNYPVNVMAANLFNGGGHANASGGEFFGSITEAVELLKRELPQYFNQ